MQPRARFSIIGRVCVSILLMGSLQGAAAQAGTAQPIEVRFFSWSPRVIHAGRTDIATLRVVVEGAPSTVQVTPPTGPPIVLDSTDGTTYSSTFTADQLLAGRFPGDAHNFVGFLDVFDGSTRVVRGNLFINVLDRGMPLVPLVGIASDMQASPHLVNIRYDDLYLGAPAPDALLLRFYDDFPDAYDFVGVVEQVRSFHNRFYAGVRNNVQGIGLPSFDFGARFGSPSRLQGIIHFPNDHIFDLAETGAIHEIGHRWINFSNQPALQLGEPHWPISDIAYGIMGYSGVGGQGSTFPFTLVPQADGSFRLQSAPHARAFNDLELYMMGLVPPESVGDHLVFQDQDQEDQLFAGGVLQGPVLDVTIQDVIAADGMRVPDAAESQRDFRYAAIILSAGGLLSREEMAYFDCLALRGEATVSLPFSSGFASGVTLPFHLATGRRATLTTTLGAPAPRSPTNHLASIVFDAPGRDTRRTSSLNRETVILRNRTCLPIQMRRWTLEDSDRNVFSFGRFTLAGGASVTLHTGPGANTTSDLFWGLRAHVWDNSGDEARLRAPDGAVVDTCTYGALDEARVRC